MTSTILKVRKEGRVTIPNRVRELIGLTEGDHLKLRTSGRKLILEQVLLKVGSDVDDDSPEHRRVIDEGIEKGLDDFKHGRVHGPFASAKEASAYIERLAKIRAGKKKSK